MIAKEERVDTVGTRLYSFRNRPPPLTERKGSTPPVALSSLKPVDPTSPAGQVLPKSHTLSVKARKTHKDTDNFSCQ
jgi:hypothetical protein